MGDDPLVHGPRLHLVSTLAFAEAGLVFLALFAVGAVRYRPVRRCDWVRLAGMVASILVGQFLLNYVVLYIPAAVASLIVQTAPLLTFSMSAIAGVERFRLRAARPRSAARLSTSLTPGRGRR